MQNEYLIPKESPGFKCHANCTMQPPQAAYAQTCVKVPVLSNRTQSTLDSASRGSPPLIRTPFRAPAPEPTMTAVGVARPMAQGQATTSVAIKNLQNEARPLNTGPAGVRALTQVHAPTSQASRRAQARANTTQNYTLG